MLSIFLLTARANVVVYGHVHIAKTAGTTVNGMLAQNFEGVCGHKGYSFDYSSHRHGLIESHFPRFGRRRVPWQVMWDRGFKDCRFISLEGSWTWWQMINASVNKSVTLQLHVPCRDPADHLYSQCNYKKIDITWDDPRRTFNTCIMGADRFSKKLVSQFDVRCFDHKNITKYIEYIDLPPKVITQNYTFRATNRKRTQWPTDAQRASINAYAIKHSEYYAFCSTCNRLL